MSQKSPTDYSIGDRSAHVRDDDPNLASTTVLPTAGNRLASPNHANNIAAPRSMDVLLGRGRRNLNHPGNLRFQELVEANFVRFSDATRLEKTEIVREIMMSIQEGGSFLKYDESSAAWVEVSSDIARIKIGQALRYRIRRGEPQVRSSEDLRLQTLHEPIEPYPRNIVSRSNKTTQSNLLDTAEAPRAFCETAPSDTRKNEYSPLSIGALEQGVGAVGNLSLPPNSDTDSSLSSNHTFSSALPFPPLHGLSSSSTDDVNIASKQPT